MQILVHEMDGKIGAHYKLQDFSKGPDEINDVVLKKSIVIPEGIDPIEYLAKTFPNRHQIGNPDYSGNKRVTIFDSFWIPEYTTLEALILAVRANGSAIFTGDVSDLEEDLTANGWGEWDLDKQIQVFYNGLVCESIGHYVRVTEDPARAKRMLAQRARRAKYPAKTPRRKLKVSDLHDHGNALSDFLWEKMSLDDIKHSCFKGTFWTGFCASTWYDAVCSIRRLYHFISVNKINLRRERRSKMFKEHMDSVRLPELPLLLKERIIKLKKNTNPAKHNFCEEQIKTFQKMLSVIRQCYPRRK